MARVRGESAPLNEPRSMVPASGSTSQRTGVAPVRAMAATVGTHVFACVTTSSPGPTPSALSASSIASVPLAQPTAWRAPITAANSASNASPSPPRTYQPLSSTRATAASISGRSCWTPRLKLAKGTCTALQAIGTPVACRVVRRMGLISDTLARLPEPVRARLRPAAERYVAIRMSRMRWTLKHATLKRYGVSPWRRPARYFGYLLVDPELDNFTYDLSNDDELAAWLGDATGEPRERFEALLAELRDDREFLGLLRAQLRQRIDRKQRPMFGRRAGWYALARLLKPETILETGIHDGLGSALLLRALERNAGEGHEGSLVSVDINPAAGWLVPDGLRSRWTPVFAPSDEALPGAVEGRKVEMFIHD